MMIRRVILAMGVATGLAVSAGRAEEAAAPKGRVVLETTEVSLATLPIVRLVEDSLCASPDGKRVGYTVSSHNEKNVFVFLGLRDYGKAYEPCTMFCPRCEFDEWRMFVLTRPFFSPDSNRVLFEAARAGKQFVVVDGVEGPAYDRVCLIGPFSPDSKRVAYTARRGEKELVVVDGVEGPEFNSCYSFTFSPDSKRVLYQGIHGDKWSAVIDGVVPSGYDESHDPVFSPNSLRVAFVGVRDVKRYAVVDGQESMKYEDVQYMLFSPDSKHVAYTGKVDERWLVAIDGKEGRKYERILGPPVFSPDSSRVAYWATSGKKCTAVVDGVEGKEYDLTIIRDKHGTGFGTFIQPLVFSPDSRHAAYVAKQGKRLHVVIDGEESRDYDRVVRGSDITFDAPDRLHFVAQRDREVFRVEIRITKP